MFLAADLNSQMEYGFIQIQISLDTVILYFNNIRILFTQDMREMLQSTRYIQHQCFEFHVSAAAYQSLFNNLVYKGNIDISSGQNTVGKINLDNN